ncbi:MAG TPA: MAPEG family protein, partial [Xanthomonadales bacterium]|nr:MAPEG family protein [Xanthomonadales bacterium]
IWLYLLLGNRKQKALLEGRVDEARRSLDEDAWPDDVRQVNNAIRNQFELPVLFYLCCLMLWALQLVNLFTLVIACAFVFSRFWHAGIQTGSNYVPMRRKIFTLGAVLLVMLYFLITYRLILQIAI